MQTFNIENQAIYSIFSILALQASFLGAVRACPSKIKSDFQKPQQLLTVDSQCLFRVNIDAIF